MQTRHLIPVLACLGSAALLAGPAAPCQAHEEPYHRQPAFDFTDEFYRANGIDPDRILGRPTGDDDISVEDASPHPDFTDVRIIETTGGFDHSGDLLYYTVNGMIMPDTWPAQVARTMEKHTPALPSGAWEREALSNHPPLITRHSLLPSPAPSARSPCTGTASRTASSPGRRAGRR
jgi:hypothetical protein